MNEFAKNQPSRPVMLCILDGWGYRVETENNAIALGATPNWDQLTANCPLSLLETSGLAVGLPDGQMGNSEVGHMSIGSGRVVLQDLPRINDAISNGELKHNRDLQTMIAGLRASGGSCHIAGLLSPGGVHSHSDHIIALARILDDAGIAVRLHCFMDGRDTPPTSGAAYMADLQTALAGLKNTKIAMLCGRYNAMDRDNNWGRVQKAYDAMVLGQGASATDPVAAIRAAYDDNITDEFIEPVILGGFKGIADGDGLLMANFRADRAREILAALTDPDFTGFTRTSTPAFASVMGMVEYSAHLNRLAGALFPTVDVRNTLGETVAKNGGTQLRIAETEKYAHVTFFLNGGEENNYDGEDRILVPSPKVATYDLQPEMSAPEVEARLLAAIKSDKYDLIVVNFANPDMVGHTGVMAAALKAVATIDGCIGRLQSAINDQGGVMLITADHGNIETMLDPATKAPHTAHTTNLVPFLLAAGPQDMTLDNGTLKDVAPTILSFMALDQPSEMSGKNLCRPADSVTARAAY